MTTTERRDLEPYQPPEGGLTPAPIASGGPLLRAPIVPVLDHTDQWAETGRLRLGDSVQLEGRRGRQPRKLDHYRVTSPDRDVVALVAELYRGEVVAWPDAPGGEQWQVYIEAPWLDVIIPPAAAATQWWEHWDKPEGLRGKEAQRAPVVCLRRCNGQWDRQSRGPCRCAMEASLAASEDPEAEPERLCQLFTRLSVLLTDVPDLGVWRLETKGVNAGRQLATFLQLIYPGLPPFTRLQLGVRVARRPRRLPDGGAQLVTFPVPVLRVDPRTGLTVGDLLGRQDAAALPPPPAVAAVAARVSSDADAPGRGADRPPTVDATPGPGAPPDRGEDDDPWYQGAPSPAAEEVDGPDPWDAEGAGDQAGQPDHTRAEAGPRAAGEGPVFAWCLAKGLSPGAARHHLASQHADDFGPKGRWPLDKTIDSLDRLDGPAAQRAIEFLEAYFTRLPNSGGGG